MKCLTIAASMVAFYASVPLTWAQDKPDVKKAAAPASDVADELKQMEDDWMDALKTRNADKLAEILADTWVGIRWDSKTLNKTEALAELKRPGNSLDNIERGPMKVRIFGNLAVVTGSHTERSTENGKNTSAKYVWTNVFVKQDDIWKAVASQSTKVPK